MNREDIILISLIILFVGLLLAGAILFSQLNANHTQSQTITLDNCTIDHAANTITCYYQYMNSTK